MGSACKVLLVEDDADTREAVAAVLEGAGFRVAEAADGAEALEQLRTSECVCLVLLDLFMPRMNGWAFLDERAKDPRLAAVPIVVVSADAGAARRAAGLGVAAALAKPLDFDRLVQVVARHC